MEIWNAMYRPVFMRVAMGTFAAKYLGGKPGTAVAL